MLICTYSNPCLTCNYRNELLGLEGMVKLKNPDDNIVNRIPEVSIDPKASSNSSTENESKRYYTNETRDKITSILNKIIEQSE